MKKLYVVLAAIVIFFVIKEYMPMFWRKRVCMISPMALDWHHVGRTAYNVRGYHDPSLNMEEVLLTRDGTPVDIEACVRQVVEMGPVDGVVSSRDYVGNIVSCLVARELGLSSPNIESVLTCQHKFLCRQAQQRLVPEATPKFELVDPKSLGSKSIRLKYPFFIKPVKSYFSMYAQKVNSFEELQQVESLLPPRAFLEPLDQVLKKHMPQAPSANYLLAEELLGGEQVTLEGFVFDGEVSVLGVTDSIMYPGTISFERFEYPSSLPQRIQDRMMDVARRFMSGIGFDNAFFNIEFFYDTKKDSVHIIEVNPRSVAQFADLYEKVDGVNSYKILLDIAAGVRPRVKYREGRFKVAASCALRTFEDGLVTQVPTKWNKWLTSWMVPDAHIRVFAQEGKRLSDKMQDGKSYMYAIINLGGDSREDLLKRLGMCKKQLPFTFTQF